MPFKANADRRHRIPKQRHRVTNWREYDAALRARGSLTVWFSDEAIQAWQAEPHVSRGGQPRFSTLAIATALTLRAVFHLALGQTEGLIGSILLLLGLDFAVPAHSEYDAALRQRGSLTVWFTEAAIAAWRAEPQSGRGVNRSIRLWRLQRR